MLQLFSDKGTVDDLGIGTVRDAISNSLFPGTSVIQTRARYFLFVPWLFRRAEQTAPPPARRQGHRHGAQPHRGPPGRRGSRPA